MALYLNQGNEKFIEYGKSRIFVDKSIVIKECNALLGTIDGYMCVTRPRRFGKTLALSMLNAYYSKGCDSKSLFDGMAISKDPSFVEHLNKHNVIWIDMAGLYTNIEDVSLFVPTLKRKIVGDLAEAFPSVDLSETILSDAIIKVSNETGSRFVFLIDEWDVLLREEDGNAKLCDDYIKFLRGLFKSSDVSSCIDLVYMTGILPIRRYSTQSAINMFREYNMVSPKELAPCAGFTAEEVKTLCAEYHRNFDELREWYDGYRLDGIDIYSPKSIVEAVLSGKCKDYWVQTSSIEAVTNYMNYDHGELKDVIAKMLAGYEAMVDPSRFDNDLTKVDSCDAALTVLIHLGYLAYNEDAGTCRIPNREIRMEFERALAKLDWSELYDPISNSEKMYEETMKGNLDYINATLDRNHKEIASAFNKNKEDVLGVVVLLSYYKAKRFYNIKKEDVSSLGRADLTFIPYDSFHMPLIIELKVDSSPEKAIKQIKEREYVSSLGDYKGKVMLLGISYDEKTLKHDSKIEIIER